MITRDSVVTVDPEIMGGRPVFKGTHVPVQTLIEYLERGHSIDYFLDSFPSVTRKQATAACELFTPDDYAFLEYGVTSEELDAFVKRTNERIARERKAGTMKRYSGDLEADIAD
ncbi:MAG: DUF433 domain-containing protein [Chthoniobacterales bacterium]